MKNLILLLVLVVTFMYNLNAQNFLEAYETFSKKADAIVTLMDGQEIKAPIEKIKFEKRLVEEVILKVNGKKKSFDPKEIKHMYAKPGGLEKLAGKIDFGLTPEKWNDDHSAHAGFIKDGYMFFEQVEVETKKKSETYLLQLLNPGFANGIKVYNDPKAKESMGVNVGGMNVAGGNAKSYYIKKGNGKAIKVYRKNYDDEFSRLYGDCPAFTKEYPAENGWINIEKHVYFYSENCGN